MGWFGDSLLHFLNPMEQGGQDILHGVEGGGDGLGPKLKTTPSGESYLVDKYGHIKAVKNTIRALLGSDFINQAYGPAGVDNAALLAKSRGVVGDTLSGKDLSPDSNPYLKQVIDHLTANSENSFGRNLSTLYGNTTLGSGPAGNTKTGQLGAKLALQSKDDLDQQVAQILSQNYATGKQQQLGVAVPASLSLNKQPYDLASMVLGIPSTGPAPNAVNEYGPTAAAGVGALAALVAAMAS